jgi:hypothetical protein
MKTLPLLKNALSLLIAFCAASWLRADVVSFTVPQLPDYEVNAIPTPRVNVLSVDLDPLGADLVGQPGETIGWSFKISWASNAGDSLVFHGSRLGPESEFLSAGDYVDLIGDVGGDQDGRVLAGTDWASPVPFVAGTHGIGHLTLKQTAMPGHVYRGTLSLEFKVYADSETTRVALGSFSIPIEVSVTIGSVELTEQTITFPEITAKAITSATFAPGATSDSGLPVAYISLNPDLCTVENGIATLHAAGEVAIVATQEGDTRYAAAPSVTRFFEITKNAATVEIQGNLDQTYTGSDKLFAAVTQPENLPVKWLYNGLETPPREPGIYIVDALIDHPVHEGRARARLTITDTSPAPLAAYADWLLTHFTPQEIQDGLVTARTADLAEDGTPNLLKYALGLDPWTTMSAEARSVLPRFAGAGGTNALVFSLPLAPAGDLIVKVEASSDLVTWEEIARRTRGGAWTGTASVFTGTPDEAGVRAETLVTEPALPVRDRRFYRLNIEFAP